MTQQVRAGTSIMIVWIISQTFPFDETYSPPSPPTINIIDTNGTVQVSSQSMSPSEFQPVGTYQYLYTLSTGAVLGNWSTNISFLDANNTKWGSPTTVSFQVVS